MNKKIPAITLGHGKPHIAFVTGIHGDESIYSELLNSFQKIQPLRGKISLILANVTAAERNIRFIEADLNRNFPGKSDGVLEEQVAFDLTKTYKNVDCLVDFHSFHTQSPPFTVLTNDSKAVVNLAKIIGLRENVIMPGRGVSFVEQVKLGIGVELGVVGDKLRVTRAKKIINNVLSHYGVIHELTQPKNKQYFYQAAEKTIVPQDFIRSSNIKNFRLVKKGEEIGHDKQQVFYASDAFFPILLETKGYGQTLCRNGKRIFTS